MPYLDDIVDPDSFQQPKMGLDSFEEGTLNTESPGDGSHLLIDEGECWGSELV